MRIVSTQNMISQVYEDLKDYEIKDGIVYVKYVATPEEIKLKDKL